MSAADPTGQAGRRLWIEVAGVTVLGALLRFPTIGTQSYSIAEAATLYVLRRPFGPMFHASIRYESTPPLSYLLGWVWVQVFGTNEAGLRSLSALAGVATVPLVYAAGRALVSRRVGLAAAVIVATNPFLVYYSQELRSYALYVLLSTLALLFCVQAIRKPATKTLVLWGAASFLAAGTHYFALFALLSQAAALVVGGVPRRLVAWSSGATLVACTPFVALAHYQSGLGNPDWIGDVNLLQRIRVTVEVFAFGFGFNGTLPHWVLVVCGLLGVVLAAAVATAGILLLRRADGGERRAALIAAVASLGVIVLPIAAALVGQDYVLHRNFIAVLPPLALVLGAGLGCRRAGGWGVAGIAAVAVASTVLTIMYFTVPELGRPDFRTVAHRLGPAQRDRVVVLVPRWEQLLQVYQHGVTPLDPAGRAVSEIDVITQDPSVPDGTVPDAFRLVDMQRASPFNLFRYRSASPVPALPGRLGHYLFAESGRPPVADFQPGR